MLGFPLSLAIVACAGIGLDVKVYMSDPAKGGMVREQANELVPYAQTKGWFAMTPSDAEAVFTRLKQCEVEE